ncbi:P glycoprotein 11 [Aphelenchoides bicaudatus]|nr:P glycoprotein 11 [Aphelenchoides bicaudatus]
MGKKSPKETESTTESDDELSSSKFCKSSSTSSFSIISAGSAKHFQQVSASDAGNQSDVEDEVETTKPEGSNNPKLLIEKKARKYTEGEDTKRTSPKRKQRSTDSSFSFCSSEDEVELVVLNREEDMQLHQFNPEKRTSSDSSNNSNDKQLSGVPVAKVRTKETTQTRLKEQSFLSANENVNSLRREQEIQVQTFQVDERAGPSNQLHMGQRSSSSASLQSSNSASKENGISVNRTSTEELPQPKVRHYDRVPHQITVNRSRNSSSCSSEKPPKINKYDFVPFERPESLPRPNSHLRAESNQDRPTPKPRSQANSRLGTFNEINNQQRSSTRLTNRISDVGGSKKQKGWNGLDHVEFTIEAKEKPYRADGIEKWVNILLCRGDLTEEDFEARPVSFIELFKYGEPRDKQLVVVGILFAIISGIGQPIPIHDEHLRSEGYKLIAINGSLGVFMLISNFLQYFILRYACQNIIATLRARFISSILRQNAAWFDDKQFGAINSQLNEQINCIRDGIAEKIGLLVRGVAMFLTTLFIAFYFNWKITLIMIPVAPLSCLSMSFMARLISAASQKQTQWLESSANILQESILNVRTVQSVNGQEQILEKFKKLLKKARIYGILVYFWNGLFDGLFFFILYLFYTLGFCYGAVEEWNGHTTAGDVFITTNVLLVGAYFLGVMSPHLMAILKARVSAAIIYKQIERVPEIDCYSNAGITLNSPRGHIEFKDVYFVYPTRKTQPVLKGVSWTAEQGETVAIVGHSGSGKSTSVGLLTRLYDCTSGNITIDGVDIRQLKIHSLRRLIGIVQQEPVLFNATIYENIALGDLKITQADVEDACRIANAQEFIHSLPNRYNTIVGPGSIQLSGGQKQRIAIARAIVRNPPILLLDEATSALDAHAEIQVQTALREASKGRTTIVIAHRLSTLRDVQKIIVMDKGKVIETGSHTELASRENGIYASMVKAQQFKDSPSSSTSSMQPQKSETNIEKVYSISGANKSEVYGSTKTGCSSMRKPSEIRVTFPEPNAVYKTLFSGGLIRLYRHCDGSYSKLILGTIATILRAFEMPFYVLVMYSAYGIFTGNKLDVERANNHRLHDYVTQALDNVLNQDAAYFDKPENSNAKLIQRIGTDSIAIKAATDVRAYQVLNNSVCSIVQIIMALAFCWQVALVGLSLYTLLLIALWFLATQLRSAMQQFTECDDSANVAVEIIENSRTIQLLTQERYFLDKFTHHIHKCSDVERKIAVFDDKERFFGIKRQLFLALTQTFLYFSDTCCYAIGIFLLVDHVREESIYVFAACQSMAMLAWIILLISLYFTEFLHSVGASDSLLNIIEVKPQIMDNEELCIKPPVSGDVSVEEVVFAYPNRPHNNVSDRLTLHAQRGETIALVGPSGNGKSTIIGLLQRFYNPKSGDITIDDIPISHFALKYLRQEVALVGQQPVLFSGSIYENICLGMPGATRADVIEACQIANASDFIERLPETYETQVGSKGSQLSGGQKQRIAIARALIRKPRILLLDEATSALDAESEQKVQMALEIASRGRTTIMIAHRLSSIVNADRIYFISGGKVVEHGTHIELLKQNGLYAEMIRKQDL